MSAAAGASSLGDSEHIVLKVGAPAHGGHCIAYASGSTQNVFFVRDALPSETVRAEIMHKTSKVCYARAVEVLEASPDRVQPVWFWPAQAGGAELRHVRLQAQLTWKRWVLADCLRRIGGNAVQEALRALPALANYAVPVQALPREVNACNSADVHVRDLAGTVSRTRISLGINQDAKVGMHAFHSSQIIAMPALPLAVNVIQELGLTAAKRWQRLYRPAGRVSVVAPSAEEPLVLIDGKSYDAAARPLARKQVTEIVDGSSLGLGKLRYRVPVPGFWQVHPQAPQWLVSKVVCAALLGSLTVPTSASADYLLAAAKNLCVLELYAGAGLFTLPLALLGARIGSLEGSKPAVQAARRTLRGMPDIKVCCASVNRSTIANLAMDVCAKRSQDTVAILDPPRKGAGCAVIAALAQAGISRAVMVFCDPAAFSRDLKTFLEYGYCLKALEAFDMFPHTHHFETVAIVERT